MENGQPVFSADRLLCPPSNPRCSPEARFGGSIFSALRTPEGLKVSVERHRKSVTDGLFVHCEAPFIRCLVLFFSRQRGGL